MLVRKKGVWVVVGKMASKKKLAGCKIAAATNLLV